MNARSAALAACEDPLGCVVYGPGEAVHVGMALSFEFSELGPESRSAVELVLAESSVAGRPLRSSHFDDGCSPDGAVQAAEAIVADGTVAAVIGTICSGAAFGAAPILSAAGISMISPANTAVELTAEATRAPGYFRVAAHDGLQGATAAQAAYELGLRRVVALAIPGDGYSLDVSAHFKASFEARGGSVTILEVGASLGETFAHALRALEPDLVFGPLFDRSLHPLLNLTQATAPDARLMVTEATGFLLFEAPWRSRSDGTYFSDTDAAFMESAAYQAWADRYAEVHGAPPLSYYFAHAIDAARVAVAALEEVGEVDGAGNLVIGRQALRDAIAATQGFPGVTGTLSCGPTGDCATGGWAVFQRQGDDAVRVSP